MLSSVITIVLLVGITIPIIKHILLKEEISDIGFNGPYLKDASIQDAIIIGQYGSINDTSGLGALIKKIRGKDLQQYIPAFDDRGAEQWSLLWFYRFTPIKLHRKGGCLEVMGTRNTNDMFCFIIAPYKELHNVITVQTMNAE